MNRRHFPLVLALGLSLLLHAAAVLVWRGLPLPVPRAAPASAALAALIVPRVAPPPAQPPLSLPETPPAAAPVAKPSRPAGPAGRQAVPARPGKAGETARLRQAAEQLGRHLLYPPEAVARGLEGEATVLVFLDESGYAVAARLERSSGHAILDEAAVRAAREVRAGPGGAASEFLLPVRFRLR